MRMQNAFDIAKAKVRTGKINIRPHLPDLEPASQPNLFEGGEVT